MLKRLLRLAPPAPANYGEVLCSDMHSHLIPGIDDGAETMADSLELIRGMKELGYRRLYTTPHVIANLYPNTREVILKGLARLRRAADKARLGVEIDAAAEYMLDERFLSILEADEVLPLPGRYLLVEMGFIAPPPGLHNMLFRIQTRGFTPIMAHPERYGYYAGHMDDYQRLRDLGCVLQLNLLSLTGYYGADVQRTAEQLLRAGHIGFIGTDLHHSGHLEALREARRSRTIARMVRKHVFHNAELK